MRCEICGSKECCAAGWETDQKRPLLDEEILRIAAKSPPFIPWLLQEGVTLGDVRGMAIDFARAIEKAHGIGETE